MTRCILSDLPVEQCACKHHRGEPEPALLARMEGRTR